MTICLFFSFVPMDIFGIHKNVYISFWKICIFDLSFPHFLPTIGASISNRIGVKPFSPLFLQRQQTALHKDIPSDVINPEHSPVISGNNLVTNQRAWAVVT